MIKVRLILPEYEQEDINIMLPGVPQIGSEFSIRGNFYKVNSVSYEVQMQFEELGQISVYLEKI
jgi:sorbitol-specific phosphotransferase system component IIA